MRHALCSRGRTMKRLLLPLTVLLGVACSSEVPESSGESSAITIGRENSVYPEAVVIDMAKGGMRSRCTGTLIAPRVVLTAGHCVLGFSSWTIEAPAARDTHREQVTNESLLWDWGQGECGDDCLDLALLLLPQPMIIDRYPDLAKKGAADGVEAVAVGRMDNGRDLANKTRVSRPTTLREAGQLYVSTGVFLEHGDSGGPLFLAGTHEVIGVSVGIQHATDLNAFQRFESEIPTILSQIEKHGGLGKNTASGTCDVSGRALSAGESIIAPDGCNSCTCGTGGRVACTELACSPNPSEATCNFRGKTLRAGDSVPMDSCNSCTCRSNGSVACTELECRGNGTSEVCVMNGQRFKVGERVKLGDGCNTCGCQSNGSVVCTKVACY